MTQEATQSLWQSLQQEYQANPVQFELNTASLGNLAIPDVSSVQMASVEVLSVEADQFYTTGLLDRLKTVLSY